MTPPAQEHLITVNQLAGFLLEFSSYAVLPAVAIRAINENNLHESGKAKDE